MAREIKFRARHKLKKRWFTGREILGYINIISNDDKYIAGNFLQIPSLSDYDFVFVQYTGLTDKNGVEIYDGDIVDYPNNGINEVKLEKGCCWLNGHILGHLNPDHLEVIGNVFENPELLGGE